MNSLMQSTINCGMNRPEQSNKQIPYLLPSTRFNLIPKTHKVALATSCEYTITRQKNQNYMNIKKCYYTIKTVNEFQFYLPFSKQSKRSCDSMEQKAVAEKEGLEQRSWRGALGRFQRPKWLVRFSSVLKCDFSSKINTI